MFHIDYSGDVENVFVENLLRTLYGKFYQNQPSYAEDMTKHFDLLFIGKRYWNLQRTRHSGLQDSVYRQYSGEIENITTMWVQKYSGMTELIEQENG